MKKGLFWALPLVFLLAGCAPSEPDRQPGASPGAERTTPVDTEDVPLVADRYHLEYDSPDRYPATRSIVMT